MTPPDLLNLPAYRIQHVDTNDHDYHISAEIIAPRLLEWKSRITPEVAPAFSDLVRAWDNWTPWILGYFDHPITNA